MVKVDLKYTPILFSEERPPAYNYFDGSADGFCIQIRQIKENQYTGKDEYYYRHYDVLGLAFAFQQERALMTGNDDWIARRIKELELINKRHGRQI